MIHVSFLVSFFQLVGIVFWFFSDLGLASVAKWGPGPNKVKKNTKIIKKGDQKGYHFHKISLFVAMLFCCCFLEEISEVFFSALVAEVSKMGGTWRHFPRHVAAKLESWKLWFRLHQTLLFRVLRGWVRTCWATFFKIFSKMALETLFYDFLRNLGSSRSSKDDFW